MSGVVVAVTGGRTNLDRKGIWTKLDQLHAQHNILMMYEGGARGADRLCREWAIARGVPWLCIPADWKVHGESAGPIRNSKMLDLGPQAVIAFRGCRGTADMVMKAQRKGLPIW